MYSSMVIFLGSQISTGKKKLPDVILKHSISLCFFLIWLWLRSANEFPIKSVVILKCCKTDKLTLCYFSKWITAFLRLAILTFTYQACYIFAVKYAEASVVGFFQCLGPALTLMMGISMGIEKFTKLKLLSIAFGTVGTLCVSVFKSQPSEESTNFLGCFLLFLEAVCISMNLLKQKVAPLSRKINW